MPENNQPARAQKRESVDPEERIRPMPLLPAVIAIGMVLFGVIYIAVSGPYSRPWMGDERTLADLKATFPRAMYYRSRYTVLDVSREIGWFAELVDEVFAPGGLWT